MPAKKIIAYSLFLKNSTPHDTKYLLGVVASIASRDQFFPDWTIVIVHDKSLEQSRFGATLRKIFNVTPHLVTQCVSDHEHYPAYVKAGYRFWCLQQEGAEAVLLRDIDSPLTSKDAAHVNTWLQEEKSHVLSYPYLRFPLETLQKYHLERHLPQLDDEKSTAAGLSPFSGGGTAVNVKKLKNDNIILPAYAEFIKTMFQPDENNPEARQFDEKYLAAVFQQTSIHVQENPMVMICHGKLAGKGYDQADLCWSTHVLSDLKDQEPLIGLVDVNTNARQLKERLEGYLSEHKNEGEPLLTRKHRFFQQESESRKKRKLDRAPQSLAEPKGAVSRARSCTG